MGGGINREDQIKPLPNILHIDEYHNLPEKEKARYKVSLTTTVYY